MLLFKKKKKTRKVITIKNITKKYYFVQTFCGNEFKLNKIVLLKKI